MSKTTKQSLSFICASKVIYATFNILKRSGGQLPAKEILQSIPNQTELTDWERERYEKSGYIRWQSILHFYSIGCTKAAFLRKNKGIWYLTEEGESAISLGAEKLTLKVKEKYKNWDKEEKDTSENQEEGEIETEQKVTIEQLQDNAIEGITNYIRQKNPYEFQDLVAALLRAMGYYTPFISPKGKDGGIDIIAFNDPLGASTPRIKVQVKHKPDTSVPVEEIRSLLGILNKDSDIGLFITSGVFTSEAARFSRDSHIHVKLIDGVQFIELWKEFYSKLPDEDKNLLPLHPIYFLGTNG